MKRIKRHKIKNEKPETSSAFTRAVEEHDLAYYIHDRVELMHQVFSVLKTKDLKAMAPECVRRLSIDDLQELCTEELLGISSKRLLAVLDGAEPPSDTESSSQSSELLEAISLDSISSDEEMLSQGTKKKRKHKRRDSKSKRHKSKKLVEPQEEPEKTKASRAGLTVLELLELQARARAIRAQLQQEHAKRTEPVQSIGVESSQHSSDSDIEVKEEPAEVVEIISSEDEKPRIQHLENAVTATSKEPEAAASNKTATADPIENNKDSSKKKKKKDKSKKKEKEKIQKETVSNKESDKTRKESTSSKDSNKSKDNTENNKTDSVVAVEIDVNTKKYSEDSHRTTKRVNDLIITVPQRSTRKIKLNRNKMTVSIANNIENEVAVVENTRSITSVVTIPEKPDEGKAKAKDKNKKKPKKKTKRQSIDEDHDQITLQLSDSEKMDLLENFDKRNYDNVSSSSSDSESSSSNSSANTEKSPNTSKELDKSQNKTEGKSKDVNEVGSQSATGNISPQGDTSEAIRTSNIEAENNDVITKDSKEKEIYDVAQELYIEANKNGKDKCDIEEKTNSINDDRTNVDGNANDPATDCITKESERSKNNQNPETPAVLQGLNLIENEEQNVIVITKIDDIPVQKNSEIESQNGSYCERNQDKNPNKLECEDNSQKNEEEDKNDKNKPDAATLELTETNTKASNKELPKNKEDSATEELTEDNTKANDSEGELSEGELSEQESSEVEAFEVQPEVVCISDDETPKKKKKKDKKAKKEKKKKSDFRENADQNFYQDPTELVKEPSDQNGDKNVQDEDKPPITLDIDDDIYEIFELSDDSSCYEVEGATLSKEPTVEEIAALSAKIDEIEREEVVTEQEILTHEKSLEERNKNQEDSSNEDLENISWKDRYLGSKKVKKVLTTSNILNAMRKKNKELKKKMEESKKREQELEAEKEEEEAKRKEELEKEKVLEEGSIDQYNTLEASTKYVDPVPDPVELAKQKEEELKEQEIKEAEVIKEKEKEVEEAIKAQVTGEMKKDAKQLLNMYKKLLKYNDIKKQKDPNKKKSNKKKKKKEKDSVASTGVAS